MGPRVAGALFRRRAAWSAEESSAAPAAEQTPRQEWISASYQRMGAGAPEVVRREGVVPNAFAPTR